MGQLPSWYKGAKRECTICGFWYYERDPRIVNKGGKWYCRKVLDTLTEEERAIQLQRRMSR